MDVLDHGFRRAGIPAEKITSEMIITAKNILFLKMSALANRGIPLWSIQRILIPMYVGTRIVPTPTGVVDVLNVNLRTNQRLSGTASASSGTADNAFDGDLDTACTNTAVAEYIQLALSSATRVTTVGILPNASGTWTYTVEGSDDGVTFTTLYTATAEAVVAGTWIWFDFDADHEYSYYRLQAGATTTLDVTEFVLSNTPMEVPAALINRDDYFNLPDKSFLGRPTQYWLDKQRDQLEINLWPSPGAEFTFAQLVVQAQYYLQDVGTMSQTLDIPQRWYDFIVWSLSADVILEMPEADRSRLPVVEARAGAAYQDAWAGETDRAPLKMVPRIRPYTR